ncbi:MAG: hypothetical protein ABR583_01820 [Gaiellaceae bacterium]
MGILAAFFFAAVKEARANTVVGVGRAVARTVGGTRVQTRAWISAEAAYLSDRKVTVVCAATAQEWVQRLMEVGLPAMEADEYYGFSLIRRGEIHLSPYVCEGLRLGAVASTRRSHELQVAWSVNVLVHESVHMARFTLDEKLTEACARIGLPIELHRLYRVAYYSAQMRRLTSAATWFRRTQAPAYQGGTCSAPAE